MSKSSQWSENCLQRQKEWNEISLLNQWYTWCFKSTFSSLRVNNYTSSLSTALNWIDIEANLYVFYQSWIPTPTSNNTGFIIESTICQWNNNQHFKKCQCEIEWLWEGKQLFSISSCPSEDGEASESAITYLVMQPNFSEEMALSTYLGWEDVSDGGKWRQWCSNAPVMLVIWSSGDPEVERCCWRNVGWLRHCIYGVVHRLIDVKSQCTSMVLDMGHTTGEGSEYWC